MLKSTIDDIAQQDLGEFSTPISPEKKVEKLKIPKTFFEDCTDINQCIEKLLLQEKARVVDLVKSKLKWDSEGEQKVIKEGYLEEILKSI